MQSTRSRWSIALAVIVIVLAVFAVFSPALQAHFVNWDDEEHIVDVQGFRGLDARHLAWMFTTSHMGPYQPLSWLSLAVDHALWGLSPGLDAMEAENFHATNLFLHALAAVTFFFVARKLFEFTASGVSNAARTLAAALAALLFAIHPLRVESVAWVTERRDVLSGLFFLLAVAAWLHSKPQIREGVVSKGAAWLSAVCAVLAVVLFFLSVELPHAASLRWSTLGAPGLIASIIAWIACGVFTVRAVAFGDGAKWLAIAMTAFACALMSKGLTLVLPALLVVIDVWPLRRLERRTVSALVVEKLPLIALLPIAAALAFWGQASLGHTIVTWESHTLSERFAQACYGFCFYPLRTLWPVDLLPIHELPSTLSFSELRFWSSALACIAITALLIGLRKRFPAALAAWIAFIIAVSPVIGFTQAGPQLVADRYSYLACMPFALLGAGAWLCVWSLSETYRIASLAVALSIVAVLGMLTFRQTRIWHDTETLFEHVIAVNPASQMALRQLATYRSYQASSTNDEAERTRLLGEASEFYRRALAADSHPFASLVLEYGTNLMLLDRPREAVDWLRKYVAVRPEDPMGQTNLGAALGMLGESKEALECFERAVQSDPSYAKAWRQLAAARDDGGNVAGAIAAYEQLLRLLPNDPRAMTALAALKGRRVPK